MKVRLILHNIQWKIERLCGPALGLPTEYDQWIEVPEYRLFGDFIGSLSYIQTKDQNDNVWTIKSFTIDPITLDQIEKYQKLKAFL
jgi:hypothetical protein